MITDMEFLSYSIDGSIFLGVTATIKFGSDVYHFIVTPYHTRKDTIWLIDDCQVHGAQYTIKTVKGSCLVLSYGEFVALTLLLNRYLSSPLHITE